MSSLKGTKTEKNLLAAFAVGFLNGFFDLGNGFIFI